VPLPLLSYGGTSRVATAVILALLVRTSAGPWFRARRKRRGEDVTAEREPV
jgi:cell division protein FtsW (lipid II flippase)